MSGVSASRRRSGFTLIELMIALVVVGIFGAAAFRLFATQSRFFDLQQKQRSARAVSRASLNLLLSELRMVEATGGVRSASSLSVSLRVPYAFGIICDGDPSRSVVSLLPADSLGAPSPSGYAWRDAAGRYSYVETPLAVSTGSAASVDACTAAGITTLAGGSVVEIAPPLSAAPAGAPIFLHQVIEYDFAPSVDLPGRLALWRSVPATGARDELAAPFDTSARFRFYVEHADTSTATVPAWTSTIGGLELVLDAQSEQRAYRRADPERSLYRASVFFSNALR